MPYIPLNMNGPFVALSESFYGTKRTITGEIAVNSGGEGPALARTGAFGWYTRAESVKIGS